MPRAQLWALTGGNGAGKSTFYAQFLAPKGLSFVNSDRIAQQLNAEDPLAVSYDAARIADRIREELVRGRQSFCFETVFSHPSKVDFIAQAKALGYEIVLVFIHLDNIALNKARVQQRVSEGGHAVPEDKIESRLPRTLRHIKTVIPLCDRVELLDNSSHDDPFRRIASVTAGDVVVHVEPPPAWAVNLLAAG